MKVKIQNFVLVYITLVIIATVVQILIFLGWSLIDLQWVNNFITWAGVRLELVVIFFFALIVYISDYKKIDKVLKEIPDEKTNKGSNATNRRR